MFPENPKESTISGFSKAAEIIGQLGEELAFVAPDQDTGLLPINRFVMDLEELVEADVPPSLTAGLQAARAWLDQTLDGPGTFTEETIRNFNEWHAWMTLVLLAWQTGTAMPALPEGWAPTEKAGSATTFAPSGVEEPSICLNLPEDFGLLREFHGESVELLQGIEQGVLVLEENPAMRPQSIRSFAPFTPSRARPVFCISTLCATSRMIWNPYLTLCAARSCELPRKSSI